MNIIINRAVLSTCRNTGKCRYCMYVCLCVFVNWQTFLTGDREARSSFNFHVSLSWDLCRRVRQLLSVWTAQSDERKKTKWPSSAQRIALRNRPRTPSLSVMRRMWKAHHRRTTVSNEDNCCARWVQPTSHGRTAQPDLLPNRDTWLPLKVCANRCNCRARLYAGVQECCHHPSWCLRNTWSLVEDEWCGNGRECFEVLVSVAL